MAQCEHHVRQAIRCELAAGVGRHVPVAVPVVMSGEDYASFRVDGFDRQGQLELRLVGELDIGTADRLRSALAEVTGRGSTIVLDLSGLDFIDSSGLHELVVALKRERAAGGDIVLREPSPQTRRVLEIVGLTQLFVVT